LANIGVAFFSNLWLLSSQLIEILAVVSISMEHHIVKTICLSNFMLALIAVNTDFPFWIYGSG
jgi:hypothetical protein